MNGAERVFTRVRRSFGMHTWHELDELVSAGPGWAARCVRRNLLTDAALIRIHEETGIHLLELLDLRDCRLTIEPMPILPYTVEFKRNKRRGQPVAVPDQQRERFEQWAMVGNRYTRRDGESYYDPVVAICWKAWKAALNQP